MSRHLADHRTPSEGGRVKNFMELARAQGEEGSHPASKELRRRPVERDDARRVEEFVRIERGRTA